MTNYSHKRFFVIAVVITVFLLISFIKIYTIADFDLNRLSEGDIKKVENILAKLSLLIQEKRVNTSLSILTFSELYAPLNRDEKKLLKSFKHLNPRKVNEKIPYRGIAKGKEKLVLIRQKIKNGIELYPQLLPEYIYGKYVAMMEAMKNDIGKQLYVESGYRSSAYQLYLLIDNLKRHGYSIKETIKFVALPGYSEHGSPKYQAIDFINEDGIDGSDDPKKFEDLAEYKWLLKNAHKFGFILSYPRDSKYGTAYEPWHWHYEKSTNK